ncbi:reversion-inducing cysteine-rich protein with Kazal motifs [Anthonomus grandis grandis]|uniref:reversion-inducing cysteine-rich protein with Kazal motifs n=1 Tax=Anthonomus grandis grandis TaxID=2921223 RepID=UPI002165670D|nr:reversion-inducing cysteine-rich protein with Kazal motifs [Anthonomus grandis grandis]
MEKSTPTATHQRPWALKGGGRVKEGTLWWFLIGIVMLLFLSKCEVNAQDLMCCTHTSGTCRSICENISLVVLAGDLERRNSTILQVESYCSPQLIAFWECLNATINDISRGDSWPGRACCQLPYSENCRRACVTATSAEDLSRSCRQSDEIPFFTCIDKQQTGEDCCSAARSDECAEACSDIFHSQLTPNKYQRQKLKEECEQTSPRVIECVKDLIKVTPVKNTHKHMHCCDISNNIKCRETCKEVLSEKTTFQEMIDGLELGDCGLPLPQERFWQCFMSPPSDEPNLSATSMEISRIERVGMDSAKWHCCQRANSTQCSRLCSRTFTKSWSTSWDDFHLKCLSSIYEETLRNCIDEVDEPCELGCDGLSFCTNFNNRPTELFRSCTSQADEAARSEVTVWQNQNNITMPGLLTLPLKPGEKCSNIWKAVACTLQIKPCSRHAHANQICRDVCLEILQQCADWSKLSPIYSAERICETLSPEDPNSSCVRVDDYLRPSNNNYPRITGQVSSPCKANPCEPNEVCLINKGCSQGLDCKSYICQPGCKLGEVSQYMVPDGTYVRIPIPNNPKGSLKICKCNKHRIEECQPLLHVSLTSCLLGNQQQLHGSTFNIDCNTCSCFAGELICTKKQCENSAVGGRNTAYTTLPCNCPPHYMPVCGRNGITYPSACLAKCAGLNDADIDRPPCPNPCKTNICPIGQKCVPKLQICLSLMDKSCKQYECINGSAECDSLPNDPVCDEDNQEYYNSCLLAHHNAKLAYRGPCLKNCRSRGHVCGINGRTYSSECAAHADMISVDYDGPCLSIGLMTKTKSKQCPNVKCPHLPDDNCLGLTPPGACCPLCGGALRLLYSRKQIDRALYALQNKSTEAVNLRSFLKGLDRQIQVAQCTIRGYVTVESDVFVVVQSTERSPSSLQLEACVREAEKLGSLVNSKSPRIASELSLSSLTVATSVHTDVTTSGGQSNSFSFPHSFSFSNSFSLSSKVFIFNLVIVFFL